MVGSLIFKSLIRINFTFFNCKRCIHTVTWLRDFLDKPKRTFFFFWREKEWLYVKERKFNQNNTLILNIIILKINSTSLALNDIKFYFN